jgi:2-(3-amino-3-carboxypropyl)histidine synthase
MVADGCKPGIRVVPVSQTTLKTLYIFVEIAIDPLHLSLSVRRNFPSESTAFQRTIFDRQASGSSSTSNNNSNVTPDKGKGRLEIGIEEDPSGVAPVAKKTKIALVSTVQFISAVHALREALEKPLPSLDTGIDNDNVDAGKGKSELLRIKAEEVGVWRGAYEIVIPQSKPLSPGEVLGCTAPKLDDDVDALM